MSANTVMPLPICPPRSCYAGSDAVEFLCAVFPCTAARTCLGEGWYRSRRFRPPFHIVTVLFYAPACGHSQTAATAIWVHGFPTCYICARSHLDDPIRPVEGYVGERPDSIITDW